jgi:tetratricopeptide (TPR) repeat protein
VYSGRAAFFLIFLFDRLVRICKKYQAGDKLLDQYNHDHSSYDLATLYRALGKIDLSIHYYELAREEFKQQKDYSQYLKCQNALLRIHSEALNSEAVNAIKEEIQDLVLKDVIQLTADAYYTLGICSNNKGNLDLGLSYFEKSLDLAFQENNSSAMAYAIFGVAVSYYGKKDYEKAEEEIYKLKVFFEVMPGDALIHATSILHGLILIEKSRLSEALEKLWKTYELLKKDYDICSFVNVLYVMGKAYMRMNKNEEAKLYFGLALKSNPKYFVKTKNDIEALLSQIEDQNTEAYDLVVDMKSHVVREKERGEIDFRNQFILLELIQLLAREPGKIYSKEDLVKRIWNQDYNPNVHDNKVYVTIKRLRKLVEPNMEKPQYIYRSKNGYFINQNLKIKVSHPN